MMKAYLVLFSFILVFFSCNKMGDKPKNLIPEDKMIDVLYDFALIEGIKSDPTLNQTSLNAESFVYKKHHIDSLQFVQSNQYYSLDIDNYKKMYEKLNERIESEKKLLDDKNDKKNVKKSRINNKNKRK